MTDDALSGPGRGEKGTLAVGDRVLFDITQTWWEEATVTAIDGDMATIQTDELVEVSAATGTPNDFLLVVDREVATLQRLMPTGKPDVRSAENELNRTADTRAERGGS